MESNVKKVKSNVTLVLLLHYFLNLDRACLFVFNIKSTIFSKCKSSFTPKKWKVNSHPYSRTQGAEGSTLFSNKKNKTIEAQMLNLSKNILLISMVELDHQRSAVG